jgi:hypothetical protein
MQHTHPNPLTFSLEQQQFLNTVTTTTTTAKLFGLKKIFCAGGG